MNFFNRIGNTLKEWDKKLGDSIQRRQKEKLTKEISAVMYYVEQDSITCKCGGLAVPVFDASNKYHCVKCGSRFSNSRHHIYETLHSLSIFNVGNTGFNVSKARDRYEAAVSQLKAR